MERQPSEEYRAFVEEIGTKSFRVYNKMIALASRYVSGFQKAVRKQILDSSCGSVDLSELVMQFRQKGLGEELLRQFNGQDRKSIVPAMLAWMYFGDSFETMVAHGEDLLSQYRYNFLYRAGIVALIKHTIDISIKEGFRTQADWDSFRKRQKAIKSGEIVDWAVDEVKMEPPEEDTVEAEDEVPRRTPGRKSDRRTLPELLFDDPETVYGENRTQTAHSFHRIGSGPSVYSACRIQDNAPMSDQNFPQCPSGPVRGYPYR